MYSVRQVFREREERHVEFIRHSDLSDGDACFDEMLRKKL